MNNTASDVDSALIIQRETTVSDVDSALIIQHYTVSLMQTLHIFEEHEMKLVFVLH